MGTSLSKALERQDPHPPTNRLMLRKRCRHGGIGHKLCCFPVHPRCRLLQVHQSIQGIEIMANPILSTAWKRCALPAALTILVASCGGGDGSSGANKPSASNDEPGLQAAGDVSPDTTVIAKHSGKCMEITGAATTGGAGLNQQACNGQLNQTWVFKDMGDDKFQIVNKNSGKCVEVPDGSTADGTRLAQVK